MTAERLEATRDRRRAYGIAYRQKNRDRLFEYSKRYRETHREQLKERARRRYADGGLARGRKYYAENKLRIRERRKPAARRRSHVSKAYRIANREKIRLLNKLWHQRNREKTRERERMRGRLPSVRIERSLRARLYKVIRGRVKKPSISTVIGCTVAELRVHLESQFTRDMSWKNYGRRWHIDHIIPCAKFDLTDPRQQAICFNYLNLRPCLASENLRKRDRITSPAQLPLGI